MTTVNREALIEAMRATATEAPRAVEVPKWGTVYVRDVTVDEVEEQTQDTANEKDKHRIARGVARILCDENGARLFDPDDADDVALLAKQPWKLLSKIVEVSKGDLGN